ncbi:hypothetical protein DL766_006148 [Monosporascus sp. MC13-8B]|uniref:Fungal N-terminal domain-containing protein n=1 Tax=Monosporascus cannonballus TaxID=155416 RepID=A0ABY0HAV5_9PEZI|nr:hypothetical protein DL762_003331 [Monosporascus cannonballus]RYP00543.1 hypothetical protein DL763_000740 [Monosporascus cannonballus]RYP27904.1 hypothetical protein DL766_006148 [Monosporascus sp. MC13-8B]
MNKAFQNSSATALARLNSHSKTAKTLCNEFEGKLKDWFHNSKWDSLKANFKEAKILHGLRAEEAKEFEVSMEQAMHVLSGKLQGLELGRREVLDMANTLNEQNDQLSLQQGALTRRLRDHEMLIREGLKLCTVALSDAGKKTGNTIKLAKSLDEAKFLIAMIGDVTGELPDGIAIEQMIAKDKSKAVGMTNDADFALKFLNG